jgi:hypothetical protein
MTPMVVIFGTRDGAPRQILGFYPIRECTLAIDRIRAFLRSCRTERHIRLQLDIYNPRGLPGVHLWKGICEGPLPSDVDGIDNPDSQRPIVPFPIQPSDN